MKEEFQGKAQRNIWHTLLLVYLTQSGLSNKLNLNSLDLELSENKNNNWKNWPLILINKR